MPFYRNSDHYTSAERLWEVTSTSTLFETAGRWNEKGHYSDIQNWANFGYVPCALELLDDNDSPIMHYVNAPVMKSNSRDQGLAGWQSGKASSGDMWLAYYDTGNRKSASGWGGWKTNRQCIGYFREELPAIYLSRLASS